MTTFEDLSDTRNDDRSVLGVSALLAFGNLVTLFLGLSMVIQYAERHAYGQVPVPPQDIWQPFALLTWGLALVDGAVLTAWPRSRQAGKGILLGVGIGAFLLVFYVAVSLMAMGS